jgi:hypothetical protein
MSSRANADAVAIDRPPVDAPGLNYFVFGLFFIFGE